MGQAMFMKCSAQVHSLNLLYGTHPLLLKKPPLSLDSLQKVAYFPRPAGGAVEKNRQLGQSCYTGTVMNCASHVAIVVIVVVVSFVVCGQSSWPGSTT